MACYLNYIIVRSEEEAALIDERTKANRLLLLKKGFLVSGLMFWFWVKSPELSYGVLPGADAFPVSTNIAPTRKNGQTCLSSGNGSPNPGSGNGADYDPALSSSKGLFKRAPDLSYRFVQKSKKQKEKEKMLPDLRDSIRQEEKINKKRKELGLPPITFIIKESYRFIVKQEQSRDKFYHAPDVKTKLPSTFDLEHAKKLPYKERLTYLRDRSVLPEEYNRQHGKDIRRHVLNPRTETIEETINANRYSKKPERIEERYHLYNPETKVTVFFSKTTRQYKTLMRLNRRKIEDLTENRNIM